MTERQKSPIDQLRYSEPCPGDKRKPLSEIAAGDRVWCGSSNYNRSNGIAKVDRVTPTQVTIKFTPTYEKKYRRDKYNVLYEIGRSMFRDVISGIATPQECEAWDAATAIERSRVEADQKAKDECEAVRLSLGELFEGTPSVVRKAEWGDDDHRVGKWAVHIDGLTDDQVRNLAKAVKSIMVAS